MHPLVYVVILNYNRCQDTLQTISSLKQMTYPNFRLLLVDNHSSDATVENVHHVHPDVEILSLTENAGFAGGVNPGIRCALDQDADFVLVVNNDIGVDPGMLTELVRTMESPDIGASGPKIYYWADRNRIWSVGFQRHPLTLAMRGGARGKIDDGTWQDAFQVDYLLGCAVLFRASMLKKVGLFDERFYFYYEDLDLCIRTQQYGYRLLTTPRAKMWHKVAASAGIGSPFRAYHMACSSVLFFFKHSRGIQCPVILAVRSGSAIKASLLLFFRLKFDVLAAYWRGIRDGIAQIHQL